MILPEAEYRILVRAGGKEARAATTTPKRIVIDETLMIIALGGLAGDYFERPLFHIDGGIALFGSASVDSVGFVVLPKS